MKRPFKSIVSQIMVLLIATFCISVAALIGVANAFLHSEEFTFANQSNTTHISQLAAALTQRPDGSIALNLPDDLRELFSRHVGSVVYRISDEAGRTLFSSDESVGAIPRERRNTWIPYIFRSPILGSAKKTGVIGLNAPVKIGSSTVWIQVVKPSTNTHQFAISVVNAYLLQQMGFALPILMLAIAASYFIVRQAVRPVVQASALARTITPMRLDVRLPAQGMPREVQPLVDAINVALDRVEQGYRIQREFSADAAHELRTPLSVLRMRLDELGDNPTAHQLRADVDAMTRIVAQMLDFAEVENGNFSAQENIDLNQLCSSVIERHAPAAVVQGKDIALSASALPVLIRGKASILYHAVRNVIENAIKYTPRGTTIDVDVDPEGLVRVTDRGPGIRPEEREMIFRRFWRGDRTTTHGAGLGLAIAAKAIELHGGTVGVQDNPAGGSIFILDLRRARIVTPQA
ncbi:ATP-binding protein [Rhizomicrobium electricum]|uniref:histidine kinase n=1 Tax=Rhizomicrobium electricum TaxID=480070 RepID=A0ABN1F5E4_9PROT